MLRVRCVVLDGWRGGGRRTGSALVLQVKRQCRQEKSPTVDRGDERQQLLSRYPGFRARSSAVVYLRGVGDLEFLALGAVHVPPLSRSWEEEGALGAGGQGWREMGRKWPEGNSERKQAGKGRGSEVGKGEQ